MTELKLIREEENRLLHRKKMLYETVGATPKKEDVLNKIAALTGKPKEALSLKRIKQAYGSNRAYIEVNVYEDKEHRLKYEPLTKAELKKEEKKE